MLDTGVGYHVGQGQQGEGLFPSRVRIVGQMVNVRNTSLGCCCRWATLERADLARSVDRGSQMSGIVWFSPKFLPWMNIGSHVGEGIVYGIRVHVTGNIQGRQGTFKSSNARCWSRVGWAT
jgi:hypothetical protein